MELSREEGHMLEDRPVDLVDSLHLLSGKEEDAEDQQQKSKKDCGDSAAASARFGYVS